MLVSRGSSNRIRLIPMDHILATYYIYHSQDKTLSTADVIPPKIQGCRILILYLFNEKFCYETKVEASWNMMAHAQKPDFVFRRNGRVHLHRRGRQFSRLLAAEVCASAVVMLDTPCSEVVWRVLATHSIRQFPLHFPSRASPCAITFQLEPTKILCVGFFKNMCRKYELRYFFLFLKCPYRLWWPPISFGHGNRTEAARRTLGFSRYRYCSVTIIQAFVAKKNGPAFASS